MTTPDTFDLRIAREKLQITFERDDKAERGHRACVLCGRGCVNPKNWVRCLSDYHTVAMSEYADSINDVDTGEQPIGPDCLKRLLVEFPDFKRFVIVSDRWGKRKKSPK